MDVLRNIKHKLFPEPVKVQGLTVEEIEPHLRQKILRHDTKVYSYYRGFRFAKILFSNGKTRYYMSHRSLAQRWVQLPFNSNPSRKVLMLLQTLTIYGGEEDHT